jgi:hypothetical protein
MFLVVVDPTHIRPRDHFGLHCSIAILVKYGPLMAPLLQGSGPQIYAVRGAVDAMSLCTKHVGRLFSCLRTFEVDIILVAKNVS